MSSGQAKKLYILYILEILRKYSDDRHRLRQQDIIDIMQKDYDVSCERKAVARNISDLQCLGYDIETDGGYYLAERDFEDSELRLLIDSVLASRYIPANQARDLIAKLADKSNVYFKKQVRHVSNIEKMEHTASQLFYTIEVLSQAIEDGRKVRFFYNRYDETKTLRKTAREKHLVNPYQIVVANGRYYLIANIDKYSNSAHFRVEKISDVEITDLAVKPVREVDEFENGLNLPQHMAEHIYMFSGRSQLVRMRVLQSGINDVIDWLGTDIQITRESEETLLVDVRANPQAMKYWAVQFGEKVEILLPESLREEVRELVTKIYNKYER
jgi:predicted DNA-binding transcriptional regulator YafY